MPFWGGGLSGFVPPWSSTAATTAVTQTTSATAQYNSPLANLFFANTTSTSTPTNTLWYAPTGNQWGTWGDQADQQLMQVYQAGLLQNQFNEPSHTHAFVAAAPTIIRPHDEREAAWRREIMLQQAQLANERSAENQQRREAAKKRAHELLLEHLTPEQRDAFTKNGWFIVQGGRTGQRYRINGNRGLSGNVDVVGRDDRVRHRLCAHLDTQLPMGDQLVAQKLMLEFDEDHFLRTANRHAA